ncbi:MAG: MOSC domain-containing protein [Anaerolineae bacterium]|nr:MOSC domain-containing protein [Anaerolineae bacterium]
MPQHFNMTQIEASLVEQGLSPADNGTVEMIVCRPDHGERLVLEQAEFDLITGLLGDNWQARGNRDMPDGSANPDAQIAIMNSRTIHALTQDRSVWPLAGDQLFLDLDLSADNLPPGQRLAIGSVILEVTALPHNGCGKFNERFGSDATKLVNSREGRAARRRGINTRIVQAGKIRVGDRVTKL